jgi:hypothetical protein
LVPHLLDCTLECTETRCFFSTVRHYLNWLYFVVCRSPSASYY